MWLCPLKTALLAGSKKEIQSVTLAEGLGKRKVQSVPCAEGLHEGFQVAKGWIRHLEGHEQSKTGRHQDLCPTSAGGDGQLPSFEKLIY